MALGATDGEILRSVLGQAAGLGVAGTALGLAAVVAARPLWTPLAEDAPVDPVAAAAMAGLLVAVAGAAGCLPARRASPIEPTLALKGE